MEVKIESLLLLQEMMTKYQPFSIVEPHIEAALNQTLNEYFNQIEENL